MNNQKILLFVGAHPDDETFGLGGTLAHYAASGVKVYYTCATRGEAGETGPGGLRGFASMGDMRWDELQNAARELGLTEVFHLGYRDSGMEGSEDNKNPAAFINAPVDEAAGRVVKIIRSIKPQVIITADPIGGYRHPDHIAAHKAAVRAFHAAGDSKQYPETGPAFQPQKLYYTIRPHKLFKTMVRLMPLFGQDPRKQGKNQDIDWAEIVNVEFPVHAIIKIDKRAAKARERAFACHISQIGGMQRRRFSLFSIVNKFRKLQDLYMRAYPEVTTRKKETDLFAGIR
jgi:LmbE family N-acetylglucosaminyl deacetylase